MVASFSFSKINTDFCQVFLILLLGNLEAREIRIMSWRYYNKMTLREIAGMEGTSHQRIDQIIKRSLIKLRKSNYLHKGG